MNAIKSLSSSLKLVFVIFQPLKHVQIYFNEHMPLNKQAHRRFSNRNSNERWLQCLLLHLEKRTPLMNFFGYLLF